MNLVSQISPVTDSEAAMLARPGTFEVLADEITGLPPAATGAAARSAPAAAGAGAPAVRPRRRARRLVTGVPVAAALAIAGLLASSAVSPGEHLGPVSVGPASAQAMTVTRHGGYLYVIVRNPVADPKKYRAEFARYHLNVSLRLVPVSPSIVGTVVYASYPVADASQISPITARGRCWTGGGGAACPVGVRVSVRFRGAATLVFGRAARPGEIYDSTGLVTAPGEAMHGLHFAGRTVRAVTAMLSRRGVAVAQFRFENGRCQGVLRHSVPGSWHVSSADPWAPGQVMLSVTRVWPAASCTPPPGAVAASPSPSPAGA